MPRRSKGALPQSQSDTVLFGHIASRLEGVEQGQLNKWADELGIEPRGEALRRRPDSAARLEAGRGATAAIQPWLLLDWADLNFFMAIVRLQIALRDLPLDQLEDVPGVIELFALNETSEVTALVIYERRRDKENLQLRLAEFGEVAAWTEVSDRRSMASRSTLRWLTREAATRERMRKSA